MHEPHPSQAISVRGARVHNLAQVDLDLPRGALIAFTGVSGSGKSSLAFDTLHAEGQRRLLDALSPRLLARAGALPRPDVDLITGLPVTVGVSADPGAPGPRSTIATRTDVQDLLRALWAHRSQARCPVCGQDLPIFTSDGATARLQGLPAGARLTLLAPVARGRVGPLGELIREMSGLGFARARVDGAMVRLDEAPTVDARLPHDVDLVVDRIRIAAGKDERLAEAVGLAWGAGRGRMIALVHGEAGDEELSFVDHPSCPLGHVDLPSPSPGLFSFNTASGACGACDGLGHVGSGPCPECQGARISATARCFRIEGLALHELLARPTSEALRWLRELPSDRLTDPLRAEAGRRVELLARLGLGRLPLGRGAQTLSSGEQRRLHLAATVSAELSGALYVVDEPTADLSAEDGAAVLGVLRGLVEAGNTVIAVSHDAEIVRAASWVVDFGPGAGAEGGRVLYAGPPAGLAGQASATGRWLRGELVLPPRGRAQARGWLTITGVEGRAGSRLELRAPLGAFTLLSGPGGSGKTDLLERALGATLAGRLSGSNAPALPFSQLTGADGLVRLVRFSRAPIGRSVRSCVATAAELWGPIRRLLAETREAKVRGLGPEHFSFNLTAGRCEACEGAGVRIVRLHLLPDVLAPCERCEGRRLGPAPLTVRFRGANAADLLAMTVGEARRIFVHQPSLEPRLRALHQAGLDYLRLGQPADTLSGGEAQRVRLARELGSPGVMDGALVLLDGPSVGLHAQDTLILAEVLLDLVARGATVIAADNDPVLRSVADHVQDLAG